MNSETRIDEVSNDDGIIVVVLQRFERYRLPGVIRIKKKLDQGDSLSDIDIEYLGEALLDVRRLLPLIERNHLYRPLYSSMINYYKQIIDQATDIYR